MVGAMDASTALSTLHGLDPQFRDICDALYPGLEPAQIAKAVYPDAVAKAEPDQADIRVLSPKWRNGRGHTKGRGRRKIDNTVKETRFVKRVDKDKVAHRIGLGTTAIGTGISAVALPKHIKELPHALKAAKTSGQPMSAGIKDAVHTVRNFSKPAQAALPGLGEKAARPGLSALKAGAQVARRNPRLSAGLAIGATALHTANLGGEAIATHVLAGSNKPKKVNAVAKWEQAQAEIVAAYTAGHISKAEAMALGREVAQALHEVVKASTFGAPVTPVRSGMKLTPLKAPTVAPMAMPAAPKVPGVGGAVLGTKPKKVTPAKPAKPAAPAAPAGVGKSFEVAVEIAKADPDAQQCFGWASVTSVDGRPLVDKQGDVIDIAEVEKAAYEFVQYGRAGGVMHQRGQDGSVHKVADMIESFVVTPDKRAALGLPDSVHEGWFVGFKVTDPQVWDQVKAGEVTAFSVHGTGQRIPVLVE